MGKYLRRQRDKNTPLILQSIKGHDEFKRIYEEYKPIVSRYLSSLNDHNSQAVIDNMAQEVFVRLLNSKVELQDKSALIEP